MTLTQGQLPFRFLQLVEASAAQLEDPDHHLIRKRHVWFMRACISRGPKLTAVRRKFSLKTADVELARIRRDRIFSALESAGMLAIRQPTGGQWNFTKTNNQST